MGYLSIKDRNTVKPLACPVLPKGRKICKPVASKVADYCALAVSCQFTSLTHQESVHHITCKATTCQITQIK